MILAGTHCYPIRIYYEDTDAGGIVYHANYLRFAERARTEALRELGVPHAELVAQHNLMFVVRRLELDYIRPARLDDSLTVVTTPLQIAGASITLWQCFERREEELGGMKVRLACVGVDAGRPERIPPRWQEALQPYRWREAER